MQIPKIFRLVIFALMLILYSCGGNKEGLILPYFNTPEFTPEWISPDDPRFSGLHKIDPFRFINQDYDTVDNSTFTGKIYVANFFFTTCPGICPIMTDNMIKVQDAFSKEEKVLLLSHSVTPKTDSVPQLQRYASSKGVISGKWHLITGDREEIYTLARQSYFVEEEFGYNKSYKEFLHTEHLILVDPNGSIRGVYNGTVELETKRLIEDIQILLREE